MKEIAVARASTCSPVDFAFWVKAAEVQLLRDFYPAWRYYLPLGEMPVVPYGSVEDLVPNSTHTMTIVDTIDDPGLAGYHTGLQAAGYAFGRALPNPVVITHEIPEMAADPFVNLWHFHEPTGRWIAREVTDPVERDTYEIEVEIMGIRRLVTVSNFVKPAFFGMINHDGSNSFDHLGLCTGEFDNRGYLITRDEHNTIRNVFASRYTPIEMAAVNAKGSDRYSRTAARG